MTDADDVGTDDVRTDDVGTDGHGAGHDTDHDAESVARILCLRQLDVRARTRVELARYLRRKGVPDAPADRVLDRFTEVGLIDDRALAESFVVSRHQVQGLARHALAVKLRQRGVDDGVVEAAVDLIDSDSEIAAAWALAQRRLRSVSELDASVQIRRLVSFLARKGYPPGLAYRVARESVESHASGTIDARPPGARGRPEWAQLDLD